MKLGFLREALRRWPLIILGSIFVGWAVITAPTDTSEARLLLYGLGNLLIGAGLAVVLPLPDNERKDDDGRDQ